MIGNIQQCKQQPVEKISHYQSKESLSHHVAFDIANITYGIGMYQIHVYLKNKN